MSLGIVAGAGKKTKLGVRILASAVLASVTGGVFGLVFGDDVLQPPGEPAIQRAVARLDLMSGRFSGRRTLKTVGELVGEASPLHHEVSLDADECVSLVLAGTVDSFTVMPFAPSLEPGDAVGRRSEGANAFSYCTLGEPETVTFEVTFERAAGQSDAPAVFDFAEHRVPVDELVNLATLANGLYSRPYIETWWRRMHQARLDAREAMGTGSGPLVTPPVIVDVQRGPLLYPLDETTLAALDELRWLGLAQRTATTFTVQGAGEASPGETLPTLRWGATTLRVLAVIDARALDHCVSVEQWPQTLTTIPGRVRALFMPSGEVEYPSSNATRVCPSDGVLALAAPYESTPYRIILRREGGGAPEARGAVVLRETEPFRRAVEECEEDDGAKCLEAADSLLEGRGVLTDEARGQRFIAEACTRSAAHCWRAAGLDEGARRRALLVRGCEEGGDSVACGSLGDDYRLGLAGAVDYNRAYAAYARACELGRVGCTEAENLVRVDLVDLANTEEAAALDQGEGGSEG